MAHDGKNDVAATGQGELPQAPDQENRPEDPSLAKSETSSAPNPAPSSGVDEASRLRELQADVRDQDDLERDITRQVYPSHDSFSQRNITSR